MILVTVKNSKTGSQYICKSASKTVKDIAYKHISYHLVCRHKDHPFFKQFYHGPKGIYIDSPRYKEIEALEKPIWNTPIYKLLELTITETPPRRAYTIRKTVTRIQCRYIGGTYLLINQKQYNYDTIYY